MGGYHAAVEGNVAELAGREKQRVETRGRVYRAALEIFRRDGVAGAKIEDIVALAGVSRGSFYFHFPAKDDVLAELLAESEARVGAAIAAVPVGASLEEVFLAAAEALGREWQDDARIFPDVGMVGLKRTSLDPVKRASHPVRAAITKHFAHAAKSGRLTDMMEPDMLADLFLVQQLAVALAWSVSQTVPLSVALTGASALFLTGAGKKPDQPTKPRPQNKKPKPKQRSRR